MTRLYREPRWLDQGDPEDDSFRDNLDRGCLRHGDLYFSYDILNLIECKWMCALCPVFEDCARWGLAHYNEIPDGIMFGLTEQERKRIYQGKVLFRDWRRYWTRQKSSRMKQDAVARNMAKRAEANATKPSCPSGHEQVVRAGWDHKYDTQRYRCRVCGCRFKEQKEAA